MQALVHQLLLHQLPELVVLESHGGSALNEVDERLGAVAVEFAELRLHCGQDQLPELGRPLQLVLPDHPESVGDLEVSQVSSVLPENIGERVGRLAPTQGKVNLVEDVAPAVMEVVVAAGVHQTGLDGYQRQGSGQGNA